MVPGFLFFQENKVMAVQTVHTIQSFNAPADVVCDWFAEHQNLGQVFLARIRRVKDAEGPDGPNGVGSVRRIWIGPTPSFDETVTVFEPGQRIEYRITRGSPIKNHHGVMIFSEHEGVTTLDYTIEIESRIPGTTTAITKTMSKVVASGLRRVKPRIEALA